MWYKRYGYKQPSRNSEIGFFGALVITLVAISVATSLVAIFDSYWFLLVVFPVGVGGLEWLTRREQKKPNMIREERLQLHINEARAHIEAGRDREALESIRRVRIYSEAPGDLNAYERKARQHT